MNEMGCNAEYSHPIVLFDGLCGFCDAAVQRLLDRDRRGVLRFASLQSAAGRFLLERHGVALDLSTMVLIDDGRAFVRSHAGLRTLGHLGWPWRAVGWLRVVPAVLADPFYRIVARNRYRFKGRLEACRVPEEGQQERFIETKEDLEGLRA